MIYRPFVGVTQIVAHYFFHWQKAFQGYRVGKQLGGEKKKQQQFFHNKVIKFIG
jgi:hypothetical protein